MKRWKESINEISYCITSLYTSESGGTVPMNGLISLEG